MAMLLILLLGSVNAMVEGNLESTLDQEFGRVLVGGEKRHADNHFDVLIFTQHWPYTTCLDWEEKRHGSCNKIGEEPPNYQLISFINGTQVDLPGVCMGCGQHSFTGLVKPKPIYKCLFI